MGTHPIFESDFDCLTEMSNRIRAISYSGCGFNGIYHLGATQALAKKISFDKLHFAGASAGSIAAVSAAVWQGENLKTQMDFLELLKKAAGNHQFTNSLPLKIKELMDNLYPDNLLDYTNGRVFISLTDIKSKTRPKNVLISHFSSREHCLDCVTASCLVPVWAGYRGWQIESNKYVDGGLTNNLVNLYPDQTIRVQPFSTSIENCEISPLLSNPNDLGKIIWKWGNPTFTFYATKQNVDRVAVKALFGGDEKWNKNLFDEGFHDANKYLNHNS